MKEIELRILDINRDKLVKIILENGGEFVGEYLLEDIILDTPDKSLKNSSRQLRIRKSNDKIYLTFKSKGSKKASTRSQYEIETEVDDYESTLDIFLGLGYEIVQIRKKHRVSYKIGGEIKFEFDKVFGELDYIPEFLEIESTDESIIKRYLPMLGYTMEDTVNWGSNKIAKKYQQ